MRIAAFILFLGSALALAAQTNSVRALEMKLAAAPVEERPALLVQLGEALEAVDPSAAEARVTEALQQARTEPQRLRAEALLASLQRRRGDYAPAMKAARAGLERATALHEDALRTAFLFVIAQTHWSLTEYTDSVAAYQQVIALAEPRGDRLYVARAEMGMGIIHVENAQWDQAYEHYRRSLALARPLGDGQLLSSILNNLGNCYQGQRKFPEAWAAHREALEIRRAEGNVRGEGDSLINLGSLAMDEENFAAGLEQTLAALAIYERLGLKRHQVNARSQAAFALWHLGRTDEALEHLRAALALAETLGSQALLEKVHRNFSATYEARGDDRSALVSLRKAVAAGEAAASERTRDRISLLNVRYETARREHELEELRHDQALAAAELARGRILHYSLAAVLVLGAIASAAVFSRQRLKLRAERRIVEETRAARVAAEEANAMKTRLLSLTSHDLKGPLRSMIRGAEAIAAAPDDRAVVERYARLVRGTGEELFVFVRDLIDVAALEAGLLQLYPAPLDVAALAAEVVAAHAPRAQEKEQVLTFTVSGEAPGPIQADRARLRQAIDNLVDNAIKFTPAGGAVRVEAARTAVGVRVAVQDEGPGLVPEDYARMFQPFSRLSARPTGGEPSSGLGLSIARELVALHGGALVVDSVPGQGATFSLELPERPPGGGVGGAPDPAVAQPAAV